MADYLLQRGRQWYLRMKIPRALREHFLSKGGQPQIHITEPLGDSYSDAKREAMVRASEYLALFDRHRAAPLSPEAIRDEIEAIKRRAEGRRLLDFPMLRTELERARQLGREAGKRMREKFPPPQSNPDIYRELYAEEINRITGGKIPMGPEWDILIDMIASERDRGHAEARADHYDAILQRPTEQPTGETISQAAEAWFAELQRPDAGVQPQTLDGHRLRVRRFVEHCGDIPLASVTRAMASDFLTAVSKGRSNRTVNNYAMTLQCLFKSARNRGRFQGENPFEDQRRKAGKTSYEKFTDAELQTLFNALPRDIVPKRHTPETALPWAALISLYSGLRLEEVCQLAVADIKEVGTNGSRVWCFDIHNGGKNHLKNETSARLVPIHKKLIDAGLLDYAKALPKDSPVFPGLKRRDSKGGKIGARIGELFRKKLIALGIKRDGLCFHSLRHNVGKCLDVAGTSQRDAARIMGHAVTGITFGVYGEGELLNLASIVQRAIRYDDLRP